VERNFDPFNSSNTLLLSVVSEGEIRSIALQSGWGAKRQHKLETGLKDFGIIPIRNRDIIERYAEIDAFSQGKLPEKSLGLTSRNMGKNDLWIAATASIVGARLLTTDADFDHLNGVFVEVEKITAPY
jgi:predicted nucleic acid-binding protein